MSEVYDVTGLWNFYKTLSFFPYGGMHYADSLTVKGEDPFI